MKKRFVSLAALLVVALATGVFVFSRGKSDAMATDSRITQIQNTITELAEESRAAAGLRVDFSIYENLHLHPEYRDYMIDARSALLREFLQLALDAVIILDAAYVGQYDFPVVINMIGIPDGIINHKFSIGFASEDYFELIDFITKFTGIEREMMDIRVIGRFVQDIPQVVWRLCEITDEWIFVGCVDEFDNVPDFNPYADLLDLSSAPPIIPMGTPLLRRHPNSTEFVGFGTLGPPFDASGRTAFAKNHGFAVEGTTI